MSAEQSDVEETQSGNKVALVIFGFMFGVIVLVVLVKMLL
jgi:hypothetical protein